MSRSRRPQCSVGRGCSCCGDAGASRRRREHAWAKADGWPSLKSHDLKDHNDWSIATHKGRR